MKILIYLKIHLVKGLCFNSLYITENASHSESKRQDSALSKLAVPCVFCIFSAAWVFRVFLCWSFCFDLWCRACWTREGHMQTDPGLGSSPARSLSLWGLLPLLWGYCLFKNTFGMNFKWLAYQFTSCRILNVVGLCSIVNK